MFEGFDSMCDEHLEHINVSKHQIDLFDDEAGPVQSAKYRADSAAKQFAAAETHRVLAEKVKEPATTERAALVIFAAKKNGSLRFCVDYRKMTVVTILDSYTLLCMDECIEILEEATVFATLKPNSERWKIENDE